MAWWYNEVSLCDSAVLPGRKCSWVQLKAC